jgi:hypothetical protein
MHPDFFLAIKAQCDVAARRVVDRVATRREVRRSRPTSWCTSLSCFGNTTRPLLSNAKKSRLGFRLCAWLVADRKLCEAFSRKLPVVAIPDDEVYAIKIGLCSKFATQYPSAMFACLVSGAPVLVPLARATNARPGR